MAQQRSTQLANSEQAPRRGGDIQLAPQQQMGGMLGVAQSRAAQAIQASMAMAAINPRDPIAAEQGIVQSCQRRSVAEQAFYSYSKGGTKIFGPSVHLARMMAARWGNCEAGYTVLEQDEDESIVEAFCFDYETNHKESVTFPVPHKMKSSNAPGGYRKLEDPRDIYEHVANMAARRVRACILAVLPAEVQEMAVETCQKTLAGQSEEPLIDRAKKMGAA